MKNIDFRPDVLPLKNELYRLALRITLNPAEAEDVVQETMLKVWNRRDSWAEIESMEAFCLTICRNLALDRQKRADNQTAQFALRHEPQDHQGGTDVADTAANPEEQAVERDRVQLVRRLINGLPEKQRSCMQLRDVEGKPYKEIAEVLGITEQQVKVNIFRARQTIRQKYLETEKYGL
jgi:RNA polymerase sigma-70 factor (ECF subfamily)